MSRLPLPRLVLDTNVFVSGFLSGKGPPGQILQALEQKRFTLISCQPFVEELLEALQYPRIAKRLSDPELILKSAARLLMDQAEFLRHLPIAVEALSSDPDDDIFIAVARAAKADALVTGDKRGLLNLSLAAPPAILTPTDAIRIFQLEQGGPAG